MKTKLTMLVLVMSLVLSGCSRPKGDTFAAKRDYAQDMRQKSLDELYQKKPITREKIQNAAGYGVFSNININLLLLSTGNGYGVVHNNATGEDTYMKMGTVGVGPGLGARDFRAVIILKSAKSLDAFVTSGWEWGAHADAAAKAEEKGGALNAAGDITADMEIYQFVKNGIALQATLAGTKYWKDKDLN